MVVRTPSCGSLKGRSQAQSASVSSHATADSALSVRNGKACARPARLAAKLSHANVVSPQLSR
jgi:hypothetical protein